MSVNVCVCVRVFVLGILHVLLENSMTVVFTALLNEFRCLVAKEAAAVAACKSQATNQPTSKLLFGSTLTRKGNEPWRITKGLNLRTFLYMYGMNGWLAKIHPWYK